MIVRCFLLCRFSDFFQLRVNLCWFRWTQILDRYVSMISLSTSVSLSRPSSPARLWYDLISWCSSSHYGLNLALLLSLWFSWSRRALQSVRIASWICSPLSGLISMMISFSFLVFSPLAFENAVISCVSIAAVLSTCASVVRSAESNLTLLLAANSTSDFFIVSSLPLRSMDLCSDCFHHLHRFERHRKQVWLYALKQGLRIRCQARRRAHSFSRMFDFFAGRPPLSGYVAQFLLGDFCPQIGAVGAFSMILEVSSACLHLVERLQVKFACIGFSSVIAVTDTVSEAVLVLHVDCQHQP